VRALILIEADALVNIIRRSISGAIELHPLHSNQMRLEALAPTRAELTAVGCSQLETIIGV
jgi:hypothetical protein